MHSRHLLSRYGNRRYSEPRCEYRLNHDEKVVVGSTIKFGWNKCLVNIRLILKFHFTHVFVNLNHRLIRFSCVYKGIEISSPFTDVFILSARLRWNSVTNNHDRWRFFSFFFNCLSNSIQTKSVKLLFYCNVMIRKKVSALRERDYMWQNFVRFSRAPRLIFIFCWISV